jgi:hypothetical protein
MKYTLNDLAYKPFNVPVGTIITYYAKDGSAFPQYCVAEAFMSDEPNWITVQASINEIDYASPLYWVSSGYGTVHLDLPNVEFKPGDIVYNRNNKKFIVAEEESCSRNLTEVYCQVEGEKGVYMIPRKDLSFEPNTVKEEPEISTKTILFKDQETLDEIEFFPGTPTPEQFKAMQELSNLSQELYKGNSFDKIWIDEAESIQNAQGEEEFKPNSEGGIKFDSKKARPTLLLKSMPDAVQEVIDVLELGARKYAPDNWKKVENTRYEDAELRHKLARFSGEKYDPETKKYHLAHEICNLMFLLQKEMEGLG